VLLRGQWIKIETTPSIEGAMTLGSWFDIHGRNLIYGSNTPSSAKSLAAILTSLLKALEQMESIAPRPRAFHDFQIRGH
jgi:hypothetical protein